MNIGVATSKAYESPRTYALARAGFTDNRKTLSRPQGEGYTAHSRFLGDAAPEGNTQRIGCEEVCLLQERLGAALGHSRFSF